LPRSVAEYITAPSTPWLLAGAAIVKEAKKRWVKVEKQANKVAG
jgi:hypothetical protein